MANFSYSSNGINFTIESNDILQFSKIANADSSFKRGDIAHLINAVEIDWNCAELKNNSEIKATLNTTGEGLSKLKIAI